MSLFLTALGLFAAFALLVTIPALLRPSKQSAHLANLLGLVGTLSGSLTGLCALFLTPVASQASFQAPFGLPFGSFTLVLDGLSRLFLFPVFGLGLFCAIQGFLSLRHERPSQHNLGSHWLFYLLLLLGLGLVLSARDIVLFLVAWEIMSLAPFFLIDFNDGDSRVRDASWVYLVAAHLGAVALLAFFVLFWQLTGATAWQAVQKLTLSESSRSLLFLLALLGFGAKAGLAPMHIWLPEAHPAAPSHVSALLSGAMINAGLYGIIRTVSLLTCNGRPPEWWGWLILAAGLCTALMGILKALAQSNVKRLLAYSSVENMGIMTMGLGCALIGQSLGNGWMAIAGLCACLMHMLNHACFKGLLFLAAGEVLHATGTVNMAQLGGLAKKMPFLAACFAVGCAAIACLPPFNGFAGELVLALALLDGSSLAATEHQLLLLLSFAALCAISGLALALYAKAYGLVFLGQPRSGFAENVPQKSWQHFWPISVLALGCLLMGLLAAFVFSLTCESVSSLWPLQTLTGYAKAKASLLDSLTKAGAIFVFLLAATLAVYGLRKRVLHKRGIRFMPTWACGYQGGNARIQYTDASFSEPLARILGPLMGQNVSQSQDKAIFPQSGQLLVKAPDRLRRKVYGPLFSGIETLCNALKIFQHGKIHLYILYILVTVVGLLIWGLV
ncbi:MAG: hypothetical protein K6G15_03065 [Desulfovibrio sp.]|nr:hypothetical protein [Desulfovibrio sp.]